jgi:hypothetical protein
MLSRTLDLFPVHGFETSLMAEDFNFIDHAETASGTAEKVPVAYGEALCVAEYPL